MAIKKWRKENLLFILVFYGYLPLLQRIVACVLVRIADGSQMAFGPKETVRLKVNEKVFSVKGETPNLLAWDLPD